MQAEIRLFDRLQVRVANRQLGEGFLHVTWLPLPLHTWPALQQMIFAPVPQHDPSPGQQIELAPELQHNWPVVQQTFLLQQ